MFHWVYELWLYLQVGFFPAESVKLINDKDLPSTVTAQIPETPQKPGQCFLAWVQWCHI